MKRPVRQPGVRGFPVPWYLKTTNGGDDPATHYGLQWPTGTMTGMLAVVVVTSWEGSAELTFHEPGGEQWNVVETSVPTGNRAPGVTIAWRLATNGDDPPPPTPVMFSEPTLMIARMAVYDDYTVQGIVDNVPTDSLMPVRAKVNKSEEQITGITPPTLGLPPEWYDWQEDGKVDFSGWAGGAWRANAPPTDGADGWHYSLSGGRAGPTDFTGLRMQTGFATADGDGLHAARYEPAKAGTNSVATWQTPVSVVVQGTMAAKAGFTWEQDGSDVQFVNASRGVNTPTAEALWNFGDGTSSQDWAPNHAFATDGEYTVSLTVSNWNGGSTFYATVVVGVAPPLAAATWEQLPDSFAVQFADVSIGEVTSRTWDFGDGSPPVHDTPDPVHDYGAEGYFTASLTVTGPGGSDSTPIFVRVTLTPSAPERPDGLQLDFQALVNGAWQSLLCSTVEVSWSWGSELDESLLTTSTTASFDGLFHDPDRELDPTNAEALWAGEWGPGSTMRVLIFGTPAFQGRVDTITSDLAMSTARVTAVDVVGQLRKGDVELLSGSGLPAQGVTDRLEAVATLGEWPLTMTDLSPDATQLDPTATEDFSLWQEASRTARSALGLLSVSQQGSITYRTFGQAWGETTTTRLLYAARWPSEPHIPAALGFRMADGHPSTRVMSAQERLVSEWVQPRPADGSDSMFRVVNTDIGFAMTQALSLRIAVSADQDRTWTGPLSQSWVISSADDELALKLTWTPAAAGSSRAPIPLTSGISLSVTRTKDGISVPLIEDVAIGDEQSTELRIELDPLEQQAIRIRWWELDGDEPDEWQLDTTDTSGFGVWPWTSLHITNHLETDASAAPALYTHAIDIRAERAAYSLVLGCQPPDDIADLELDAIAIGGDGLDRVRNVVSAKNLSGTQAEARDQPSVLAIGPRTLKSHELAMADSDAVAPWAQTVLMYGLEPATGFDQLGVRLLAHTTEQLAAVLRLTTLELGAAIRVYDDHHGPTIDATTRLLALRYTVGPSTARCTVRTMRDQELMGAGQWSPDSLA